MKYIKRFTESLATLKIIFLDIDGVLKPVHTKYGHPRDEFGEVFITNNINSLSNIIEKTGAKIVISSTWRNEGLLKMKKMWIDRQLPGEVIDITPNEVDVVDSGIEEFYDLVKRGHEIQLWIEKNNFNGNYVIIDDSNDLLDTQLEHFIKTDSNIGLSKNDEIRTISILNKNI